MKGIKDWGNRRELPAGDGGCGGGGEGGRCVLPEQHGVEREREAERPGVREDQDSERAYSRGGISDNTPSHITPPLERLVGRSSRKLQRAQHSQSKAENDFGKEIGADA
ncbi:hypothetical protein C2S52_022314 [Perilla frutescens var. hirtella]|nr:hypothetical protein C2S52_022314 [Perilla frutescens var. hirtella]